MKKISLLLIYLFIFSSNLVFAFSSSENYQLEGQIEGEINNQSNSDQYLIKDSVYNNTESVPLVSLSPSASPVPATSANQSLDSTSDATVNNSFTATIEKAMNNIMESIVASKIVNTILNSSTTQNTNTPVAVTVAALTGVVAAIPLAANVPLSYSLTNLISTIFPFIGKRKKIKNWGFIYDAVTNTPISGAILRIINPETKKILRTMLTDKEGRFDLSLSAGDYLVEVKKENYSFPSKISDRDYHGGIVKILPEGLKELNIALDPEVGKWAKKIDLIWFWKKLLELLYYPLLFTGVFLSVIFYLRYLDFKNLLVLLLYLIILLYELYKIGKSRSYGLIRDRQNHQIIEMAVVRIFNYDGNKLILTKVSNKKGQYSFLVEKGNYYLMVIKYGFKQYQSETIKFSKNALVNKDIELEKI